MAHDTTPPDRAELVARYRREGEGQWFWSLPDAEALAVVREATGRFEGKCDDCSTPSRELVLHPAESRLLCAHCAALEGLS